jgi:cytochrome P450
VDLNLVCLYPVRTQFTVQQLITFLWNVLLQPFLQCLFRGLMTFKSRPFAQIPGPTPIFPIGNLLDFKNTPTWVVMGNYAQQYGGITCFWMLFRPCLALNDPDLINQVLSNPRIEIQSSSKGSSSRCPFHHHAFYKNQPRKALRPMLTETHLFEAAVMDENWRDLKDNDPFSQDYVEDWLASQIDPLHTFLDNGLMEVVTESASQGDLPVFETIQKLTFDGLSLATVGQVFPNDVFEQFNTMCQEGTRRTSRSIFGNALIPETPWNQTYKKVSKAWFKRFDQLVGIEQSPANSLLDWVLRKGGTNFDIQKLRNFFAGVYPGGAVSMPSAITSALYLLDRHPEVRTSLQAEIKVLFAQPLTLARLEACTQLDQVLRESLRLWPAVTLFLRSVNPHCATELNGHSIPTNTPLYISNWYLQRLSNHWLEPEIFTPSRWDEEICRQNDWGSDYFFPFGRGDRACNGQAFARYLMKLTLAVVLSKYAVVFDDQPYTQEFFFGVAVPRQAKARFVAQEIDFAKPQNNPAQFRQSAQMHDHLQTD